MRLFAPALLLAFAPVVVCAQTSIPPNQVSPFKDTSELKPPPGQKIAIIEFEDMECPVCARAFPVVHAAAAHYHVPLEEYDYQIPYHQWSHEAASFAHYLKAKVSPELSEDYRRQVFASQYRIASKDDLNAFTQKFMADHGKQMPFVIDPVFGKEVDESTAMATKMGVGHTPTIVVVTPNHWIEVADMMQMYAALDEAEAEVGRGGGSTAASARHTAAHK